MPNHAAWPKDTSPVVPTSRFSPMVAMHSTTTEIALSSVRPITWSAKGSSTRPAAPIHRGSMRRALPVASGGSSTGALALLESFNAFSEQAARAQHQDQEHQDVHGSLAGSGQEIDGDAAHHADQQRGHHDA